MDEAHGFRGDGGVVKRVMVVVRDVTEQRRSDAWEAIREAEAEAAKRAKTEAEKRVEGDGGGTGRGGARAEEGVEGVAPRSPHPTTLPSTTGLVAGH